MPRFAAAIIATASLLTPAGVHAQDGGGAYGRLQGDLTLELAVGGGAAFEPERPSGAIAAEGRLRYLDVAGLMVGGEWRPDGASRLLLMADVRPTFLARFLTNNSFGDRFWDLLVDSIGLDLGVAFAPLEEGFGVALAVGVGLDVPLVFFGDGVEGLSLRLFGRHVTARATDRFGPDEALDDWLAGGLLVLRGQARTGLTAWEPRRYELPDEP